MQPPFLQSLMEMGLSGLEAQAYVYLLEHAPATGYGVAKGLGKPTANTYKAMASLYERGAVLREETGNREYRAVAPDELLGALERRFVQRKRHVAAELRKLGGPSEDDRVYGLSTPDQVLERMRRMLAEAERCAILDLFPWAADALTADIEAAAARGVDVTVKAYEPCAPTGARVVVDSGAAEVLARWPGQWANGVVDGRQHLLAWLSDGGSEVRQAVWSGSPFLAWVYHTALINEILCSVLESGIREGRSAASLAEDLQTFRDLGHRDNAPGYRRLLARFDRHESPHPTTD